MPVKDETSAPTTLPKAGPEPVRGASVGTGGPPRAPVALRARPVLAQQGGPPVILPGGAEAPSAAHVARASTHAPGVETAEARPPPPTARPPASAPLKPVSSPVTQAAAVGALTAPVAAPAARAPLQELINGDEEKAAPSDTPWPNNVPGVVAAEGMLLDPASFALWQKVSKEVAESLTPIERGLLGQIFVANEVAVLKPAVLFRWRLAAIVASAPDVGTLIDEAALEAVILEGDTFLSGLKALDSMTPEVLAGFANARNLVARDVVTLADLSVKLKPRDLNAPLSAAEQDAARARATLQARAAAATKGVSILPSKSAARKTKKGIRPLYLLLIFSVLGAAGFHGWNLYTAAQVVDPMAGLNLPPGTIGNSSPNGDMIVMFIPGQTIQPSDIELLRHRAESSGKILRDLGHGMFRIESVPDSKTAPPSH